MTDVVPDGFVQPEHQEMFVAVPEPAAPTEMLPVEDPNVTGLLRPPTVPEEVEEIVPQKPSGRVKVTFGGRVWMLRRPIMRELKVFRESLDEITKAETADLGALRESGKPAALDASVTEARVMGWVRAVFAVLCPDPLPESDDDLPIWFGNEEIIVVMLRHWRTVPLVSGG